MSQENVEIASESSQSTSRDASRRRVLLPLALTQFVASFAGSSMNVSISSISKDLDTTVHGVQTAITLFLLCMAGVGAAAGPLIGGLITTTISWRATFLLQVAIVAVVVLLSRAIADPLPPDRSRRFDTLGAALSAAGMFFAVMAILQVGVNGL